MCSMLRRRFCNPLFVLGSLILVAGEAEGALECPTDAVIAYLARGEALHLRLMGPEYEGLDAAQVVQGERESRVIRDVSAELGKWVDGGRDLVITANPRGDRGLFYRIEGLARGRAVLLIPMRLAITERDTSPFLQAPRIRDPRDLNSLASHASFQPRLFSEPVHHMEAYLREDHRGVPDDPFIELARRGDYPLRYPWECSVHGYNDYVGASGTPTLILDLIPESPAVAGRTVEMRSFDLPAPENGDATEIWFDDLRLEVIENDEDHVIAKLPDASGVGVLRAVRRSDGAEATLEDEYVLLDPQDVQPYDFFDATAEGFSLINSYLLGLASKKVYKRPPEDYSDRLLEQFAPWGMELVEAFDEGGYASGSLFTDTQGMVLQNDSVAIIAFAGTQTQDNYLDYITDASFGLLPTPSDWGNGAVHAGFYFAHDPMLPTGVSVYETVKGHVEDATQAGKQVWITGHSLGGAIAHLVAFRLEKVDGFPVQGVVTFGAPRVGTGGWADEFNGVLGSKHQRWVTWGDPICTLPMTLLGYQHCDSLVNIDSQGELDFSGAEMEYEWGTDNLFDEHMQYFERIHDMFIASPAANDLVIWPEID